MSLKDTRFWVFIKIPCLKFTVKSDLSNQQERAASITAKIRKLYDDDFLKIDSIVPVISENTIDIVYRDMIIMSISESDALWNNKSKPESGKR